jgi:soluble lytic murein transglycosylase
VLGSLDDEALAASIGLDELDRRAGASLSEFDALRRARIYLANRHWAEARTHLRYIVDSFPESLNRAEALYQTGFCYYREEDQDAAITWFERVHNEFPQKREGQEGYYWVAAALQKARRYEAAASRYAEFITRYPSSDRVEGAYRNIPDCYRYAGKLGTAIEWSLLIEQRYAGQPLATVGLFNRAKIELARGSYAAALELLTRLEARYPNPRQLGAPLRGEPAFLRIYALEKMGRISEAVRLYLVIPDERDNYFGLRATERLLAIAATEAGRRVTEPLFRSYRDQAARAVAGGRWSEAKDSANRALRLTVSAAERAALLSILNDCYARLPAYSWPSEYRVINAARSAITDGDSNPTQRSHRELAAELGFLGLYDEAALEVRLGGLSSIQSNGAGGEPVDTPRNREYSLAVYSNRGNQANFAIAYAESTLRSIPRDYRLELLPRDVAELLYPAPYRDSLVRYAPRKGVDPRLVLSLARQESRFDASVKSPASARGLMQFISETALRLAASEGLDGFELDDVYEPDTALRLASRYVADLFQMFPDNPHAAAAAYNTGEQNVERWLFRAGSTEPELLLAEVAIPETKDYVAKVMCNYAAYRQLYTASLEPRDPSNPR